MKVSRIQLSKVLDNIDCKLRGGGSFNNIAFCKNKIFMMDEDIVLEHELNFDFLEQDFSVSYREFKDLISKVKDDELSMEITESGALEISGKRFHSGLRCLEFDNPIGEGIIDLNRDIPVELEQSIKMVSGCSSKNLSTPILTCVHFHGDYIEACDNFSLCRVYMKNGDDVNFSISAVSANKISSFKKWGLGDGWVAFGDDEMKIYSRLYDGEFPNLGGVISFADYSLINFPDNLGDPVLRAKIFKSCDGNMDKLSFSLQKGKAVIRGENEFGWFEEKIPIKYDGSELKFNAAYDSIEKIMKDLKSVKVKISSDAKRMSFEGNNFVFITALFSS